MAVKSKSGERRRARMQQRNQIWSIHFPLAFSVTSVFLNKRLSQTQLEGPLVESIIQSLMQNLKHEPTTTQSSEKIWRKNKIITHFFFPRSTKMPKRQKYADLLEKVFLIWNLEILVPMLNATNHSKHRMLPPVTARLLQSITAVHARDRRTNPHPYFKQKRVNYQYKRTIVKSWHFPIFIYIYLYIYIYI